ncbi:unnamed protein product [Ectocarpus sp. 6 AP-2014]
MEDVEPVVLQHTDKDGHTVEVECISLSPAGDLIAVGCSDGDIRMWAYGDSPAGIRVHLAVKLTGHSSICSAVRFSGLGDRILTEGFYSTSAIVHGWGQQFGCVERVLLQVILDRDWYYILTIRRVSFFACVILHLNLYRRVVLSCRIVGCTRLYMTRVGAAVMMSSSLLGGLLQLGRWP